ncbi:valacyclovir hydrolase-like [Discoglossus pictus]
MPYPFLGLNPFYHNTTITSGRMEVNGVNLHYQRTGRGDHAVLLLPGTLGCSQTDFTPQLKSLNKDIFTVVGLDPRGYGLSIPPQRDFPPDFLERDAKDAIDLMLALNFETFSLVGWSYGGASAIIAATTYPKLIRKLVVWGTVTCITDEETDIYEGAIINKLYNTITNKSLACLNQHGFPTSQRDAGEHGCMVTSEILLSVQHVA